MTNKEIMDIALQQSAWDCNCDPEDFMAEKNKVVLSQKHENARVYLPLPFECDLVSYGNNIVAQVSERLRAVVASYIEKYPVEHCFETPNMQVLNDGLQKYGMKICYMAEYFLPDLTCLKSLPCEYELRILHQSDFENLYVKEWSNALCENRKEKDVLAVGAYDGEKLIGLAGCSADCETMYQIGVDVLPEYRRKGIAAALTSHLAIETLKLGKVPFYCAAWSNIKSVRNAIKSGFRPAWIEMTAHTCEFVDQTNQL
ncbi:MAG: GNAT family N-acetyltransferase [Clostridia bacterium]|nr:GNAT family N-acetyltransferase [Clostridia bacterium]NCC42123.1 GNAT family N-acetyltransferase [Clostridia bacterium]